MAMSMVSGSSEGISPLLGGTGIATSKVRQPNSELGKNEFLKILTTQLQHQDPLSPMENTEFIAQMASFSTVEQILNLNKTVEGISNALNSNSVSQAVMYLGTKIEAKSADESGEPIEGTVEKVGFQNGIPYLQVGENKVNLTDLLSVTYQ